MLYKGNNIPNDGNVGLISSVQERSRLRLNIPTVERDKFGLAHSKLRVHFDEVVRVSLYVKRSSSSLRAPYPNPQWHLFPSFVVPTWPAKRVMSAGGTSAVGKACYVRRGETETLIYGEDDELLERIIETQHLGYRVSKIFGGYYKNTISFLRMTLLTTKARPEKNVLMVTSDNKALHFAHE